MEIEAHQAPRCRNCFSGACALDPGYGPGCLLGNQLSFSADHPPNYQVCSLAMCKLPSSLLFLPPEDCRVKSAQQHDVDSPHPMYCSRAFTANISIFLVAQEARIRSSRAVPSGSCLRPSWLSTQIIGGKKGLLLDAMQYKTFLLGPHNSGCSTLNLGNFA